MPRRHLASVGCAAAIVLSCAVMSRDARAAFQPGEFITHSQNSWGATPAPGNGAQLVLSNFDTLYGGGALELGMIGTPGLSIVFTSPTAVIGYLPASGGNGPLNSDLIDPTSTSSGAFGGHVLALQLNIDFQDGGLLNGTAGTAFADLVLANFTLYPDFNGMSVRQFLAHVNSRLGGGPGPYPFDDVAVLTDDITRAFEGGTPTQFARDHLIVPEPSGAVVAAMLAMTLAHRRRRTGPRHCVPRQCSGPAE